MPTSEEVAKQIDDANKQKHAADELGKRHKEALQAEIDALQKKKNMINTKIAQG